MTAQRLPADVRADILELMARYSWALDTGDVNAFVACFAPNGGFHSERRGLKTGREELHETAVAIRDGGLSHGVQHWLSNFVFDEYDGERARFRAQVLAPRSHDGEFTLLFMGYLRDTVVKIDQQWYIEEHVFRYWKGDIIRSGMKSAEHSAEASPTRPS